MACSLEPLPAAFLGGCVAASCLPSRRAALAPRPLASAGGGASAGRFCRAGPAGSATEARSGAEVERAIWGWAGAVVAAGDAAALPDCAGMVALRWKLGRCSCAGGACGCCWLGGAPAKALSQRALKASAALPGCWAGGCGGGLVAAGAMRCCCPCWLPSTRLLSDGPTAGPPAEGCR